MDACPEVEPCDPDDPCKWCLGVYEQLTLEDALDDARWEEVA